jgi:hypothetical protein
MIDELLVHISTPATRQNDDLYRSLADAYLDFEPHRTHPEISLSQQDEPLAPTASDVNGSAIAFGGSFLHGTANPSILSTSKDSYGSFPSHLSSDGHAKGRNEPGGQSFQDAPEDDSIPTSSRLAKLERIHQNWKEQTTPKSSFVGGKRPSIQVLSSPEDADTTFIENTQLGAQAIQSQLQDSYSTTDEDTSEDDLSDRDDARGPVSPSIQPVERDAPGMAKGSMLPPSTTTPKANSAIDGPGTSFRSSVARNILASARTTATPKSSNVIEERRRSLRSITASSTVVTSTPARFKATSKPSGVIPKPRASLPPSNSRSAVEISASTRPTAAPKASNVPTKSRKCLELTDTSILSVSSAQSKVDSHKIAETNDNSIQPIEFSKLPVDAFPPEPKISVAQPGVLPSQVTKHLAAIKKQNPTRFKPSKKRYTPKADNRGYWSIDCSHWIEKLQQEFWTTMCEQIEAGRLGWGATLHRETGSSRSLGKVRLYCWGEVVEHMWLVLWLCSRGKVVGSGLKWMDADGVAVFEMP